MKIAIIGCGWLGFPLAKKLVSEGHTVYGSTTDEKKLPELALEKIHAFLYDGKKNRLITEFVQVVDFVVVNFPPSKSDDYPKQIDTLIAQFSTHTKVIFTSSTGIYIDVEGEIDESAELKEEHSLTLAEKTIMKSQQKWILLRLAGLIGGERHPVKYLSGKKIPDGNATVNLVHLDDVIAAIEKVINNNSAWNSIYNICWPEHPTKKEYYLKAAKKLQIAEPLLEDSKTIGKKIRGERFIKDFDFQYSNPI